MNASPPPAVASNRDGRFRREMRPEIVFVVISAVAKPDTVDQLARSLAPHRVLVHHDFSQTPSFHLTAPNAQFVSDPIRTGWGSFGHVEAMFHSMGYALEHLHFDYLQLMSPTCLPIKPIAEFEAHVSGGEEAHFDCVDLLEDHDAFMNIAYRALLPKGSMRHRIMRRVTNTYFSASPLRRDEAGIWLRCGGGQGVKSRAAGWLIECLRSKYIGRHFSDENSHLYYGSPFIGARRRLIQGMVDSFHRPGVREHFSRVHIADEFVIPTLLKGLGASHGPMNYFYQSYHGARVGEFNDSHFEVLKASPKYFARKFPDDPASPIRARVLRELVLAGEARALDERPDLSARANAQ